MYDGSECKVRPVASTEWAHRYIQRLRNSRVAAGSAVLVVVLMAATQFAGALVEARQLVGRVLLGGAALRARLRFARTPSR